MSILIKSFKKGFRYPIYPTDEQRILLERTFGCVRWVHNHTLATSQVMYQQYLMDSTLIPKIVKPRCDGDTFCKMLPGYKTEHPWLTEVSSCALQQSVRDLGAAYARFFKGVSQYPRFKRKNDKQSFRLMPGYFTLGRRGLIIAKSHEPLVVGWHRELPSEPSSCTITRTPTGRYYISFICEYTPQVTTGTGMVGIDMGLKDFATISDGMRVANPNHYRNLERRLRRAQQSLSRKQKGSHNRQKARLHVARIHERIANYRDNFQHQLSRKLVNENQVIGIETLCVKNMVRNRRLAKSISDAGWSMFMRKLIYKSQESQWCNIVRMDTWYPSSHICSVTGNRLDRHLKLNERSWLCPHCGQTHDRDLNAAINIRNRAIEVIDRETMRQYKVPRGELILA